jgi:hypothetical protein
LLSCNEILVGLRSPIALQYTRILDTRPRQGRIIPHDDATQKKTVEPQKIQEHRRKSAVSTHVHATERLFFFFVARAGGENLANWRP